MTVNNVETLYPGATGSWEDGLIMDSFYQPYYINRAERQYPELRLVAAPLLPEVVEATDGRLRDSEAIEGITIMAEVLASSIQWWSFTKGKPTAQMIRRMRPAQLNKLYRVVSNKIEQDVDPKLVEKTSTVDVEPLAPMGKL